MRRRFSIRTGLAVVALWAGFWAELWAEAGGPGPATFSNPVIPGFAPDPSIVRVGRDFYLVNSTFEYFPGIPIYHSRDLVNWDLVGHALSDPSSVNLDAIGSGSGIHASTIRFHDGTFYVITTNNIDGELVNFVVTAENPRGPWSAPRILEGAPGIDPSLFFDDDGRAWYVGNHAPPDPAFPGEMEIWLQEVDPAGFALIGERYYLWRGCCQGVWAEGPHIYKKGGYYYLLISEGGTAYEHALSVAISESITGPYENNPRNPILTHRQLSYSHPITGVGHADFVELEDGRWYAVLLGWRLIDGQHGILGRETFLVPMNWETEPYPWKSPRFTWPVVSPATGRVELEFPLPFQQSQRLRAGFADEFDQPALGLEWNTRRTHDTAFHSLVERPGFLRLRLLPGAIAEKARYSFLGFRQRDFEFTAETELEFLPEGADDEAGITVIQNDRSALVLSLRDGRLILYHARDRSRTEMAAAEWSAGAIRLRVTGNYLDFRFDYAAPKGEWSTLAENVDATVLSPAVMEGYNYTGLYIGAYATGNGRSSSAVADYDYFRYHGSARHPDDWYRRQLERSRQ